MWFEIRSKKTDAGWSSLVARRAHNPKVVGSNPAPATNTSKTISTLKGVFLYLPFVKMPGKIPGLMPYPRRASVSPSEK